jgi:hypothetical protein
MSTFKLDRSPQTLETEQRARKRTEQRPSGAFDTKKAIGGWTVARPEGRTVHVAKPLGSKYFKDFVTKSAMTKASAALSRLHQNRLG